MSQKERESRSVCLCMWGMKSVKSFTGAMGSPIKRVWNVDQMDWILWEF